MDETPRRPCRICRRQTGGQYCSRCLSKLYPEASARRGDTQHSRSVQQTAEAYEQARAADEAEAPTKDDYDNLMRRG